MIAQIESLLSFQDYLFNFHSLIISIFVNPVSDINENGITLVTRESYFKKNYLFNETSEKKKNFKGLLTKTVLLNLRTYDHHSLILHANDNLNNFIQLYITSGTKVVLVFNYQTVIYNITVEYPGYTLLIISTTYL